ncbi:hypothetical protein [Marinobacter sp. bablab_jr008]|uniref:hypothetical protein n=1 Tax=Marinobacter sp. bablab_jr008 TaxID=2755064 RepID=UPI0018F18839|nr:hypothetical protein [Marinobacter sp. bablab_jr008]
MIDVDRIKSDYIEQIRPLLADCIYYYGLSTSLPQILTLLSTRLVWVSPSHETIGLIIEKAQPEIVRQFFEAAEMHYGEGGVTCDEELPSMGVLISRISYRIGEIRVANPDELSEFWLLCFMFRDVCSAYKSTGATETSIRVLLKWDLDGKLASMLKVESPEKIGENLPAYTPPNQRKGMQAWPRDEWRSKSLWDEWFDEKGTFSEVQL